MSACLISWGRYLTLINDLPGDGALTIERVDGDDGAFQREHLEQLGHRGNLVGLLIGGDLREDQPLIASPGAHHMQRRFAAGPIERSVRNLAVDRDDPLARGGELRHEPPEARTKLVRVEQPQHPAERVVAGRPVLQSEELTQESLLRLRKLSHVDRPLPPTQHRAQRDHENIQELVTTRVAGPRILQPNKAGFKTIHRRSNLAPAIQAGG